jgi:hypothetical protein
MGTNGGGAWIQLNHSSSLPGCEGMPGQVIETTPELAARMIENRGAVPVEPPAAKPERRTRKRKAAEDDGDNGHDTTGS